MPGLAAMRYGIDGEQLRLRHAEAAMRRKGKRGVIAQTAHPACEREARVFERSQDGIGVECGVLPIDTEIVQT